jgi:hypothetical protein
VEHWDINNEMLHGSFFPDKTGDPRNPFNMCGFSTADPKIASSVLF